MKSIPKISTILYATDLGKNTRPIFRQAIGQAIAHNAKIIMLHVVEPLSETAKAVISAYMPETEIEGVQKEGMKNVISHMKERIKKFYDEECEEHEKDFIPVKDILVIAGRPSEEILTAAEQFKADMIIMGQSSRKVMGSKVMGSSARRVARLSKVPVLIVPNM
ncbi:MAG: universal stress protein [Desulfoprunum sp.]|nr:universal stress protein [Desulfoprunum sp.]